MVGNNLNVLLRNETMNGIHSYNRMLPSNKKEETIDIYNSIAYIIM